MQIGKNCSFCSFAFTVRHINTSTIDRGLSIFSNHVSEVTVYKGLSVHLVIAVAPLVPDATTAPSVVAKGQRINSSTWSPLTRSGPITPSGILANPMRFSIFPEKVSVE